MDGAFDTTTQVVTPTTNTLTNVSVFVVAIRGLAKAQTIEVDATWTNMPPVCSGPVTLPPRRDLK